MLFILRLILQFFRLLVWPLAVLRRRKAAPPRAYVHLEIDGAVTDVAGPKRPWEAWVRKPVLTLHGVAELIDALIDDPNPRGLLVTLKSLRAGMATATSLRAQLARLRDAGREVVVLLPLGGDTREFYVATAATRIFVGPRTALSPIGFAINARYVRGALEKAGLTPEVFARGTYKSAGETFVRDSMSEAQREQMEALLATFYDELVDAVAEGRHLDVDTARARIDAAPYTAADAVSAGLVDDTAYEDEIADKLGGSEAARVVPAAPYLRARMGARLGPILPQPVIGVVRVHGPIAGDNPLHMSSVASDEAIIQVVRRARQDPAVRAVVLHIDSPGGSALASDRIHHELVRLAAEKPLIACMANVAASGGYYVAAPAHVIVAEPTTVTGSIGVIAARFTPEPLLSRLGIHTSSLRRGAHAGLLDPAGPLTDDERGAIEKEIDGIYRGFVQVVSDGRKKTVDEVHAVAEGRVWVGRDARTRGLVDELGGFETALRLARERGAEGRKLAPRLLRPPRSPLPPLSAEHRERRVARAAFAPVVRLLGTLGVEPSALVQGVVLGSSRERALLWFELGGYFSRVD
ncbi:signal peptide peptidase SppA [Pendulispora albinea]|uniref:Signal peptide peptidase SppA n=1 Tax=Pendulispora albinea TaxID=2741071 RepID=A0ABZ2LUX1_9BACT